MWSVFFVKKKTNWRRTFCTVKFFLPDFFFVIYSRSNAREDVTLRRSDIIMDSSSASFTRGKGANYGRFRRWTRELFEYRRDAEKAGKTEGFSTKM